MLTNCPECQLQVSDKAAFCPHCGYPMKEVNKYTRPKKRKRLPNGFGQISEIKDKNLRKPFRAMVTVGKSETGRPIVKPLKPNSYFSTYNDAYTALIEYNRDPYDLSDTTTMSELYTKWSTGKFSQIDDGSVWKYEHAWDLCKGIHNIEVRLLKSKNVRACIDNPEMNVYTKRKIISMLSQMMDYALGYDLCDRNVAKDITPPKKGETEKGHIPYTDEEIKMLWDRSDEKYPAIILIQCYSGWRPNEMYKMKVENVDLEKWSFTSGSKTKAGMNRTVPIHPKIRGLVKRFYDEATGEYLFGHMTLKTYLLALKKLGLDGHRPHDGRVHFVTMAKKYNVDEYAIKYIVGHAIKDITEKVYTKREFDWLEEEMQKIR